MRQRALEISLEFASILETVGVESWFEFPVSPFSHGNHKTMTQTLGVVVRMKWFNKGGSA